MRASRLFPLFIFLIAVSCSDDGPTKVDTQLVDLEVTKSFITNNQDIWLLATDMSGRVLDKKHWKGEAHLTLEAKIFPDSKINLLILSARETSHKFQQLKIYSAVAPGRQWQLGKLLTTNGAALLGDFDVQWNDISVTGSDNFPRIHAMQQSTFTGTVGSCSGGGGSYDCRGSYQFYDMPGKILFSRTGKVASPSYFETDTLDVGGEYVYDFDTAFKPFENIIELTGPENANYNLAYVNGIKGDKIHMESFLFEPTLNTSSLRLGYRNGYDNIVAIVSLSQTKKSFRWNVYKPSVTSGDFNFPEQDFTIKNESFADFSFAIGWNKPFLYQNSEWQMVWVENGETNVATINLFGKNTNGKQVIDQLPDDIVELYPKFADVNSFSYANSEFSFTENGMSYDEGLEKLFSDPRAYDDWTHYRIAKFR